MKAKLVLISLGILIVVGIIGLLMFRKETNMDNNIIQNGTHRIADFVEVEVGISKEDIIKLVGEPEEEGGIFDKYILYYLTDGSQMKLYISKEDILEDMYIIDISGRKFILSKYSFRQEDINEKFKKYQLSDFIEVKVGILEEEIVELVGRPATRGGFNFRSVTYSLDDGSQIRFDFPPSGNLIGMNIIDPIKRNFVYYEDKQ